jgi:hypothetical protein
MKSIGPSNYESIGKSSKDEMSTRTERDEGRRLPVNLGEIHGK